MGLIIFSGFAFADNLKISSNLSEIDPLKSLGNVTAPLDGIWHSINNQLSHWLPSNSGPLEPLESRLGVNNNLDDISLYNMFGIIKKGLVLMAQIFIVVLELTLYILRSALRLLG